MKLQSSFSVPNHEMTDLGHNPEAIKKGIKVIAAYWDKECYEHPSSPACLVFDD